MISSNFPLFRKTPNEKSFYKISANDELLEIQKIGSKFISHQLKAKIFPEKNLLQDMIENKDDFWININEKEFEVIYQRYLKEKID